MNSFETDVKRAIISKGFLAGFVLELLIFWKVGGDSELFRGDRSCHIHVSICNCMACRLSERVYQGISAKVWKNVLYLWQVPCMWDCRRIGRDASVPVIPAFCQERRSIKSVAYFLLSDGVGAAFRDTCGNLEQPVYRVWRKLCHLLHIGDPA